MGPMSDQNIEGFSNNSDVSNAGLLKTILMVLSIFASWNRTSLHREWGYQDIVPLPYYLFFGLWCFLGFDI